MAISILIPNTAANAETGASFLNVPASARAVATGAGGVVLADGIGSFEQNTAGIGFSRHNEIQSSYGPYVQGYTLFHMAYGHSTGFANFGMNIIRLAASDFEGRDEQGRKTSSFKSEDRVIALGASRRFFGGALAVGGAVKHLESSIESESAQGLAMDLGIVRRRLSQGRPYAFGAAIRNLGSGLKFQDRTDPLPTTASVGAAVGLVGGLHAVADVERRVKENATDFGLGIKFLMADFLTLNGGMSRGMGEQGSIPRINGGLGIKVSSLLFDYGFSSMGELGNVQRFSVGLKFGALNRPKADKSLRQQGGETPLWVL